MNTTPPVYLMRQGTLYRVDPATGNGDVISDRIWDNVTSLAAFGGALYAVQNDTLQRIDVDFVRPPNPGRDTTTWERLETGEVQRRLQS